MSELLQIDSSEGPSTVHWFAVAAPRRLLVLGPGASGSVASADLHAVQRAAAVQHTTVALVEPYYRVAGRKVPPRGTGPDDAWVSVIEQLRRRPEVAGLPLVVGGRSFGSRVACRTAVRTGACGVLALAFPEHPPGKPERSRSPELALVADLPVLCIAGDRDAFGRPEPGPHREVVVLPGDHSLKKSLPEVATRAVQFITRVAP